MNNKKRVMKFKHHFAIALMLALLLAMPSTANPKKKNKSKDEGFKFTDVKVVNVTPVKDQARAGTCWSYAGHGLFEAELLRMGKGEHDLSEMFVVYNTFHEKAISFVRYHGTVEFAGGGSFKDVVESFKKYGAMPGEAYRGLNYGEENHVHGELDAVLRGYVESIIRNRNRKLSTAWLRGFDGILDAYLGEKPESFTYKGVSYTPKSYAESLGLNMDDYVSLTSFTHHPFYEEFIVEIPDNWRRMKDHNIPLDEMMEVIDNAINNGYTVGWGSDVSERGFKYNQGFAVIPAKDGEEMSGSEKLKWSSLTEEERARMLKEINGPVPELNVTQEIRQQAFDNYETTDDHGMLIMGIAKDQHGTKYYKVKNSWSTEGIYGGYFYASETFVRYKTIDIMVHKDAIPDHIKQKLKL